MREGWTIAKVEELAANVPGALTDGPFGSNLKTSHYTSSGPRVIRLQNIGDGSFLEGAAHISIEHFKTLRRHEAKSGDVLIALLGEELPRACSVPEALGPAIVKADCARLRVNPEVAEPRYVAAGLNSEQLRLQGRELLHGVGRPRLGLRWLKTLEMPVAPLPEQQRIVEALDSYLTRLDAAEQALLRAQANLKRYRASVLKAAVEGRLVPTEAELARQDGRAYEPASVLLARILAERKLRWEKAERAKMKAKGIVPKDDRWKAKYEEPARPDLSGLPELPEGWCWASLPQTGEIGRGKSKHRPRNDPRLLGGAFPFIQTGDIRRSEGVIDAYQETYSDFGLAQSRLWPAGTLCVTIAANIAETGILTFAACFPDSVVGLLNTDRPLLVRFLEFFMRTAREALERYAPATAQKNINLETLASLAVPMPPEAEQLRIVGELEALLSSCRQTERVIEVSLQRLARLRQSILKWAFEGKLVDQDPNDEPAAELLARIRAAREKTGARKDKTRRAPRQPLPASKSRA